MEKVKPGTREGCVSIGDAAFPKPFYPGLEFNSPAHGTWNIVHIGMLIPEAREIFVCADGCMRGVVLTAAEMNTEDRFSFVLLDEEDMTMSDIDDVTIEGVSRCLDRLREAGKMPPAVLLFTVCVHHYLGACLDHIYGELEKRYPGIRFVRCFMDCILQKAKPAPDIKLRAAMYDLIEPVKQDSALISLIGSELPLYKTCDIYKIIEIVSGSPAANVLSRTVNPVLKNLPESYFKAIDELEEQMIHAGTGGRDGSRGRDDSRDNAEETKAETAESGRCLRPQIKAITLKEMAALSTYEEFLEIGKSAILMAVQPAAKMALEILGGRLGRAAFYMPAAFDMDTIERQWHELADLIDENCMGSAWKKNGKHTELHELMDREIESLREDCNRALKHALKTVGDTEIRIDSSFHPRPLELAELLLTHGFKVTGIYTETFNPEEEAAYESLRKEFPKLNIYSIVHPEGRVSHKNAPGALAVGQKAAWFTGTKHFVNGVYGIGLFGFDGIIRLCGLMEEAFKTEKDVEDIIVRKAWGCESCV